jgi:hypothetical protein
VELIAREKLADEEEEDNHPARLGRALFLFVSLCLSVCLLPLFSGKKKVPSAEEERTRPPTLQRFA